MMMLGRAELGFLSKEKSAYEDWGFCFRSFEEGMSLLVGPECEINERCMLFFFFLGVSDVGSSNGCTELQLRNESVGNVAFCCLVHL